MARWLLTVFILLLFSQAAVAVVDPRPDVMGVYFDEYGDQNCKDDLFVATPFSVWFVYTNPSVDSILGFEAGYHTTAGFTQVGLYPPCGLITPVMPELDNLIVVCPVPIATTQATPLYRIEYLYLGVGSVETTFYLEKARESTQPGNNPHVILADESIMEVQAGQPAYTTLVCVLSTEKLVWGSIKSLYR